ncbi:MAG: virulence RhuM family protein [Bacteriovoracales bacterium]|nr:virulence RhuM family protein [Bacteriovoracales bacterium]
MTENIPSSSFSDFILYTDQNGQVKLNIFLQDETLWLTQKMMAELFGAAKSTINEHLKNIYDSGELERNPTIRKFRTVQSEGGRSVTRNLEHYNLDAIIAVGYRVNSKRATQFRIWATKTLREYIIKGFVIDDKRLKQGSMAFGKDYFRQLLETVRSIRASERRVYLQITDIFAECSIDYDPQSEITRDFYAMVQNKFHFAITGKTAAEIIYDKADRDRPHMGLSTWENAPKGRVLSGDVTVAKNYLGEKEIKRLERTISGFFDYIENIIENHLTFTMKDFAESVDKFLNFNEYKVLEGKGSISKRKASGKALDEYREYNKTQKIESDFEKEMKRYLKGDKDDR